MPIEEGHEIDFDLETYRSALAKGSELGIETPDGKFVPQKNKKLEFILPISPTSVESLIIAYKYYKFTFNY